MAFTDGEAGLINNWFWISLE